MVTAPVMVTLTHRALLPLPRRTVHDKMTGSDVKLTDEQIELVQRLQKGHFGDVNFNEYEVTTATVTS